MSAICGAGVGDVAAGFGYWHGFWQWRGSGELCFADVHAAIVETEFKDAPALCHGQIFDIHCAEGFPFAGARESDVACKQFVVYPHGEFSAGACIAIGVSQRTIVQAVLLDIYRVFGPFARVNPG